MDLFTSLDTKQLPLYHTFSLRRSAGGPDAYTEDWHCRGYLCILLPIATLVLLKVIPIFRSFQG